jgi:integrase
VTTESLTLDEFCERYLERYAAIRSPSSVQTLRWRLVRSRREFGDMKLAELRTGELAAWEAALPPRFRYAVVRALRQVLDAAVQWEFLVKNPAKATGKNPAPPVLERVILEPAEVDRLAAEMRSPYGAAVIVGAWCYLRPAELLALARGSVGEDELRVNGTKTRRSVRTVPLPLRARVALEELPPRIDSRLLFPSPSGAFYDLRNFRRREFDWARDAAGFDENVTPYTLRHSGISWALHAGVPASDVARFGGTSLTMLEKTYAHLLSASTDAARARLDAFGIEAAEAAEGGTR